MFHRESFIMGNFLIKPRIKPSLRLIWKLVLANSSYIERTLCRFVALCDMKLLNYPFPLLHHRKNKQLIKSPLPDCRKQSQLSIQTSARLWLRHLPIRHSKGIKTLEKIIQTFWKLSLHFNFIIKWDRVPANELNKLCGAFTLPENKLCFNLHAKSNYTNETE